MSKEPKSIHEFDLDLIVDYYARVERQGPGSPEITKKALSFIENLPQHARIADIGCGSGGQTITLAQNTTGHITGIDIFPKFIDLFNSNATKNKLQNRMQGIVASMDDLPFQENEYDLLWSEGAIYNIGFEKGLREWRKFLKKEGYIAVSEASWFTEERPEEIEHFWNDAYPGIGTIAEKTHIMQKTGYVPLATFILPVNCWTKHFFKPQAPVQKEFLHEYAGNQAAVEFIENQRHEEKLYHKYKDFYGYTFFIGKKI